PPVTVQHLARGQPSPERLPEVNTALTPGRRGRPGRARWAVCPVTDGGAARCGMRPMSGGIVMNAGSCFLAAMLLTTPPGTPEMTPPADDWPAIQEALQTMAVEWEILDPREVRYILARPDDFANDLTLLRNRYQELKDAPKLNDGH